jgi:hypothetical protein
MVCFLKNVAVQQLCTDCLECANILQSALICFDSIAIALQYQATTKSPGQCSYTAGALL